MSNKPSTSFYNVPMALINANYFRDIGSYTLNEPTVEALMESMDKSGYWKNIPVRPLNNVISLPDGTTIEGDDAIIDYLAGLEPGATIDFPVEIPFGHHRLEAAKRVGFDALLMPIDPISREQMLLRMALENRKEYGTNMGAILETVAQVRKELQDVLDKYLDYEDYSDEVETDLFNTPAKFKNAKSQGIGFRSIATYLGSTWSKNDVNYCCNVLDNIEAGMYTLDHVRGMTSAGIMNRFDILAKNVAKAEWPEFIKTAVVDEAAEIIKDPNSPATVKIVDKAAKNVTKGKNPINYLLRQSHIAMDLVKEIMELIDTDDFPEDGAGFEGYEELVEDARKKIQARNDKAAGEGSPTGDEGGTGDATVDDDGFAPEVDGAVPDGVTGSDGEDSADATPPDVAADTYSRSALVFVAQGRALVGKTGQLKEDSPFFEALDAVFAGCVQLMLEDSSVADIKELVEKVETDLLK